MFHWDPVWHSWLWKYAKLSADVKGQKWTRHVAHINFCRAASDME
jgi:hypothetical protein